MVLLIARFRKKLRVVELSEVQLWLASPCLFRSDCFGFELAVIIP